MAMMSLWLVLLPVIGLLVVAAVVVSVLLVLHATRAKPVPIEHRPPPPPGP